MDTGSIFVPLWISFKLAAATTVMLLALGAFLAYLLAYRKVPARPVVESLINLPIALPRRCSGFTCSF